MIFLYRFFIAVAISIAIKIILGAYKSRVILYVPKLTKEYKYEELDNEYRSYLVIFYLMFFITCIGVFSFITKLFYFSSTFNFISGEKLIAVKRGYWILPSIIISYHSTYLLMVKVFKIILEEEYNEFVIYLFSRENYLSLKDIILRIYSKFRFYKIYEKALAAISGVYVLLGMLYYTKFDEDIIRINRYFSLREERYHYEDISYILEKYTWEKLEFRLLFSNGDTWYSSEKISNDDSEENYEIISFIKKKSQVDLLKIK